MFAAGTTFRVCELDTTCPNNATPQTTSVAIQRIILNLLKTFAVAVPLADELGGRCGPGTPKATGTGLAKNLVRPPRIRPETPVRLHHHGQVDRRGYAIPTVLFPVCGGR